MMLPGMCASAKTRDVMRRTARDDAVIRIGMATRYQRRGVSVGVGRSRHTCSALPVQRT